MYNDAKLLILRTPEPGDRHAPAQHGAGSQGRSAADHDLPESYKIMIFFMTRKV